jgi:hypothetical protein
LPAGKRWMKQMAFCLSGFYLNLISSAHSLGISCFRILLIRSNVAIKKVCVGGRWQIVLSFFFSYLVPSFHLLCILKDMLNFCLSLLQTLSVLQFFCLPYHEYFAIPMIKYATKTESMRNFAVRMRLQSW